MRNGPEDARYTLSWPGGEALPEGKEHLVLCVHCLHVQDTSTIDDYAPDEPRI